MWTLDEAMQRGAALVLANEAWRLADEALCGRGRAANFECAFLEVDPA